jgi:hypothetical protein
MLQCYPDGYKQGPIFVSYFLQIVNIIIFHMHLEPFIKEYGRARIAGLRNTSFDIGGIYRTTIA